MSYNHIKIATPQLIYTKGAQETVITAAQKTKAYREASLTGQQFKINESANGIFLTSTSTVKAKTIIWTLFGYPKGGDAHLLGAMTGVSGDCEASDGGYYIDDWTVGAGVLGTVTPLEANNEIASLKFDPVGLEYIVAQLTNWDSGDGTIKLYARIW